MKDINQVIVRKLEEMRICKVQLYCLRVVIPLLEETGNGNPVTTKETK
jgi:hypothetical protein